MAEQRNQQVSRRQLLETGVLAGGALMATQLATACAEPADKAPASNKKHVILFQGDSITDAGRSRKNSGANNPRGLGFGYPLYISNQLLATQPKANLRCYNRGISGNKVPDLDNRWEADCLKLKPDVLSILIGVNDIWHKLAGRYNGTVKDYEAGFAALLERTKKALPGTKLVVCEPFVLRCGAVKDNWFPEFDQRRAAAKRVAKSAGTMWVPFQDMFDEAIKSAPPEYWAGDGVHPSLAGHGLMAKTWIETVKL